MNRNASKTSSTSSGGRADADKAIGHCAAILANIAFMTNKLSELIAQHLDSPDGQPPTQADWHAIRLNVALIGATADRAAQATGSFPVVGGFSEWMDVATCCEKDIEQLAAKVLQEAQP